jgi:cysteine desulfurase / selenocysteine lyase
MESLSALSAKIRSEFPVLDQSIDGNKIIYLDSAATALKPKSVAEAVSDYYLNCTANVHRGKHMLSERVSDQYENVRYKVATFVGCASNEVIFCRNTTEALNTAASFLELEKEDLVIGFLDSHHSQMIPWKEKANLQLVTHDSQWLPDMDHYESMLKLNPKAVVITHCSNVTGAYAPIKTIISLAKKYGCTVVLDAAQSISHTAIDFHSLDIDILAFSSHKMFGPSGIGCLIAKSDLLNRARPNIFGGGMVDFVTLEDHQYRKPPHRFEAGTPAIEASFGLCAAIDFIEKTNIDTIDEYLRSLNSEFLHLIDQRSYIRLIGPNESSDRGPIFSFSIEGISNLGDAVRALSDSYGVMCRSGHLCAQPLVDAHTDGEIIRMSAHVYNTKEEIHRSMEALDKIRQEYAS